MPELLAKCGLELPSAVRLADTLRALGVPVPAQALVPQSIVDALWV